MITGHAVGGRLNIRRVIAAVTASSSLFVGLLIRANAEDWSRNVVRHVGPGTTITTLFDKGRAVLLQDVGAVLLGFAVVSMALLLVQWVADADRQGPVPAA
jgi:hypothetical protein